MGRHARTIRLGRTLWESAALEPDITSLMKERCFDDGTFPPLKEVKAAVAQAKNPLEERPAPFAGKTLPTSTLTTMAYGQRLASWLQRVRQEEEEPTGEQLEVLNRVADRLLEEYRLEKEGLLLKKTDPKRAKADRPLLGFCHGSPGTGKSKVIKWIIRLFTEALEWKHEDEFLCVAFQNRVAHAMGGNTLHAGGDLAVGRQRSLDHTDIDILFTRNQYLRWVIIDELPMVPDDLLGAFASHLADAASPSRFHKKADGSIRFFGGYNLLAFGDFYQIPPIPSSASLAIPPIQKKTEAAKHALELLWGDGEDSLNFFKELTIQKRIEDSWYGELMEECRYGRLSEESYNFLVGLPTTHAGSWRVDGTMECGKAECAALPEQWKRMADEGLHWPDMQALECSMCKAERDRRNRVMAGDDPRVRSEPYLSAPFIHKNNEPKYHAMLLRAHEQAKSLRKHVLWFAAVDTPENPSQIVKTPAKLKQRLQRFLQFHDQQTAGVPGLNLLYEGMLARVTEKLVKNKNVVILKHSPCTVVGWELHPLDAESAPGAERFLRYMPRVIYLKFADATWTVDKRLGPGVWPLCPVHRNWELNAAQGSKIKRLGFTLLPDYASTAFMIQGATLRAAIADCGDVSDVGGLSELMTTYVILSRVKSANGLLLLRAFCANLFQMGALPGPYCLLKLLRRRFAGSAQDANYSPADAIEEYKMMMAEYEGRRAQQKQHGPAYRCGHCTLTFPAEAFDVNRHDIADLHNMCVGLGSLRVCSACVQIPAGTSTTLCTRCKQQRQPGYFSAGSIICSACHLQEKYAVRACTSCHKAFQISQLRENSEGHRMCHECAPEAWPYRCTACKQHKPAREFIHSRKDLDRAFHTRCKTCETCIECRHHFSDHRSMVPDTQLCTKCAARTTRLECSICNKTLDREMFPVSQWMWRLTTHKSHNWFPRCTSCHTCTSCKVTKSSKAFPQTSSQCKECASSKKCGVCDQELPLIAFPKSQWKNAGRATGSWTLRCTACHCCATCCQIKDVRAFAQEANTCIDCQQHTQTLHCEACDKILPEKMFNKHMLLKAKRCKGKLVCLACADRGFSTIDVTAYHCAECGEQGHLKFSVHMLKNYKARGRRQQLVCTECCRRFATIEMNLKDKQALRCTCKGQQHSHSNEKCKLYTQKAGEKRWPGCNLKENKAVTEEDYKFCERMRWRKKQKTRPQ